MPEAGIAAVDFDYVAKLVRERSAIVLEKGKEYLVLTRLSIVAGEEGIQDVPRLIEILRSRPYGPLHKKVVEAMTTNETSFFRDSVPFDILKKSIIPELIEKRQAQKSLTIWSAASSTGQEAYSIAMLLLENFGAQIRSWNVKIIGTDLNEAVLARARSGRYKQVEVNRGLPVAFLVKYFGQDGLEWTISPDVRKLVNFSQLNLLEPYRNIQGIDIVFLRNVLIYFDVETKRQILDKVAKAMKPDGCLFLGAAETTINVHDGFTRVAVGTGSVYRLNP